MPKYQALDASKERLAARRRPESGGESSPAHDGGLHPLLSLQRQVGNAQIARMLAQRAGEDEEAVQAKHINRVLAQRAGEDEEAVQAKHNVSRMLAQRAGEDEEQVQAKHDVSRMVAQRAGEDEEQVQAKHDLSRMLAQRAGEDEEQVQAAHNTSVLARAEVGPEGGEISSGLSSEINSRRGQGSPLDDGTRTAMEAGFGTKFDNVRVHSDGQSDGLNRNLSAKAFTTGSDIFFSQGSYQPGSGEGRTLLSHELAHVVQQRSMSSGGPMRVNPAGDSFEQQADSAAQSVTASPPVAQRKGEHED